MKNVGIIRRLDALGRIVIPREYRKMNRIDLGDPLEIRAMDNGEIVLKKVDLDAELVSFGLMVATPANSQLNKTIIISNAKNWLAGIGVGKNAFIGKELPKQIAESISERQECLGDAKCLGLENNENFIATPITGDLDCFGVFCIISSEEITQEEKTLAKILARIIGENLQRY